MKNTTVKALDIFAQEISIPIEQCKDRGGVYGLILHEGKILLMSVKANGTLWFPGGATEVDENHQQALAREISEETGISVTIGRKFTSNDYYFHHNPSGKTFYCHNVYYLCTVKDPRLPTGHLVKDEISDNPHWEMLKTLQQKQFHPVAWPIIQKLKLEMEGMFG